MPIVFRYLYTFFQNIFGRKRVEQELGSYLALVAAEKVRGGMAPEEALRAARQDLWGIEQVKENVRDIRIGAFMDTLMQDLRYALRTLARNPAFSSVVILTLALGIGANTTIFTVVNGVLLKPLPYPEPERLLMLWETQLSNGTLGTVAPANFYDWRSQSHSFEKIAAIDPMYLRLAGLVTIFSRDLIMVLGLPFLLLAGVGLGGGWLWSRIPDATDDKIAREFEPKNPLEMRAALMFAGLFLAMVIVTHWVVDSFGKAGVYTLATLMGVTDVDPFIMGMTQSAGSTAPLTVAATAILIAAASNNLVKGIYAYSAADRKTGTQSLCLLATLAVVGLSPLLWLRR
jgi:Domain of unknown function (DUF4010)